MRAMINRLTTLWHAALIIDAQRARIDALEERLRHMEIDLDGCPSYGDLDGFVGRDDFEALEGKVEDCVSQEDFDALETRVEDNERDIENKADSDDVDDLEREGDSLEEEVASLKRDHKRLLEVLEVRLMKCEHDWQEQPGEPPVDVCSRCGAVRE